MDLESCLLNSTAHSKLFGLMDAMAGCWEALTDYDTLHHADGWTNLWMDLNEAGQPHKYLANQFERLKFDVLEVLLILFCHASQRLRW